MTTATKTPVKIKSSNTITISNHIPETAEHSDDLWIVYATDKSMSGWGGASNGRSKCGWVCRPSQVDALLERIEGRSEMIYVSCSRLKDFRPRSCVHFSYYWAGDDSTLTK